jgi:hypothetical protein
MRDADDAEVMKNTVFKYEIQSRKYEILILLLLTLYLLLHILEIQIF